MLRQTKAALILGALSLFILFSLASFFYIVFGGWPSGNLSLVFYNAGRLSGLIGILCLGLLIISGETARFFDRFFGMDTIIKTQRKFSLVTAFFVILHPVFFILSHQSWAAYLLPDFTQIPLVLGTLSLYMFIIIMIASQLYKRISHAVWQYLHILTYILFFTAMSHSFNIGSSVGSPALAVVFGVLWLGFFTGVIYRTTYKIRQRRSNKYVVDRVQWRTHDTFTLSLRPKTGKKLNYKAGQFCFLRVKRDRLYARHPFTISNAPHEETLDFTIKLDGRFTKMASILESGDEVFVEGPYGIFTVDETQKNNIVFVAGGVGVTPFFSIINDHVQRKKYQNITLLYGSKTSRDIIFKDELESMSQKYDWLQVISVLSAERHDPYKHGYINEGLLKEHVKPNTTFYICGPEPMKDAVVAALKNLGVNKKHIRIESFFW